MRALAAFSAVALLAACSGGGGSAPPRLPEPSGADAVIDVAAEGACPAGTDACGASGYCCPTGTACLANPLPADPYGCGAGYCCLGCTAGAPCGGGCCAAGTSCVGNPGGATACGTGLCCSPEPEEAACPPDVEAACAPGTRCLPNHSAKFCAGGFACYLPSGVVGCPGETMCPNAVDFCPADTFCGSISGVCPVGSSSGNYCCRPYAQKNESCDEVPCAAGLDCVTNPHCAASDPNAARTCKGPCTGEWGMDCGTFCCNPATTDFCGAPDTCLCWYYY